VKNVTDRVVNPFGMDPDCDRYVPGYGDANADFHVVGDHPGVHGGFEEAGTGTAAGTGTDTDTAAGTDAGGESAGDDPAHDGGAAVGADGATAGADAGTSGADESDVEPAAAAADRPREGVPFTNAAGRRLQSALVDAGLLEAAGDRPVVNRTFLSYLHPCVAEGTPSEAAYDDMERFFDAEVRAIVAHVLVPVGERATRHVLETYTALAWKTEVDMEALHGRELRGSGWLVLPVREPAEWDDSHHDRLVDALRELQRTDFRRETDLGRFFPGDQSYLVR
jgi:uracil-DNA glycosylase